jgi:SAM-dependent methyltransferase
VDFDRLTIEPGFTILDIGCGSGRHTAAAYAFEEVKVIGADRQLSDLVEAGKRLRLHDHMQVHGNGTWSLAGADILQLPFFDSSFDLVICCEVLEHIPNLRQAVAEIFRVLKSGRTLVVSVPRFFPERLCWALSYTYCHTDGGHVRIFRKNELVDLLESSGAALWASHHAHSLHSPYWWLKCLLGIEKEKHPAVTWYNRFLTWEIMQKPRWTRFLEHLLNPVLGKSLVLYLTKMTY